MGIRKYEAEFLAGMVRGGLRLADCITIGRQMLLCESQDIVNSFRLANLSCDLTDLEQIWGHRYNHTPFAEGLLTKLGATRVDSIDYSDYEKPTHIGDLNTTLPTELTGKYDTVIDFGTMEHVFDVKSALKNILNLVAPGGRYLSGLPANNEMGHGFYQFSPELFYSVLVPENGFRINQLLICETMGKSIFRTLPDPKKVGGRVELTNYKPAYLFVDAVRVGETSELKCYQSDYVSVWKNKPKNGLSAVKSKYPSLWQRFKKLLPSGLKKALRTAMYECDPRSPIKKFPPHQW